MRTLLIVLACASCATLREQEPPGEPVVDECAPGNRTRGMESACRAEDAMEEAQRVMKAGGNPAQHFQAAQMAIDETPDPEVRVFMRIRLAELEAKSGFAYMATLDRARADADQMKGRDQKGALSFIKGAERHCAEVAADYHLRTAS